MLLGLLRYDGQYDAANLSTILVAVGVAAITLADLFGWFTIGTEAFSRVVVFMVCAAVVAGVPLSNRLRSLSDARPADGTRQVPAHLVGRTLKDQLEGTSEWVFRGGSGRWLREITLPSLATASRRRAVSVSIHILDPGVDELCARYATYRAQSREPGDKRADGETSEAVRSDLLSCVYAAGYYAHRSRLSTSVTLLPTYSPLRVDLGDSGVVVTVASKAEPGLVGERDGWYWVSMLDELNQARRELPSVVLPTRELDSLYPSSSEKVTPNMVRAMLLSCEVAAPGRASESLITEDALEALDLAGLGRRALGLDIGAWL